MPQMPGTCGDPGFDGPFSFGLAPRTLILVTVLIGCTPFFVIILAPFLIQLFGRFLGWILLKKTDGRRALLVSLMDEENAKSTEPSSDSKSSSSEEWEKVSKEDGGVTPAVSGSGKSKDFDGIIGFFHPFW